MVVVPDTQYYLDYTHQTEEGFPFNARQIFFDQMRFIADRTVPNGGDIAFVTAVGDVWQHQTLRMDPEHAARGLRRAPNPALDARLAPSPKTLSVEMHGARAGYAMLAGKVPFSVVPGNHDYDAQWTDARHSPAPDSSGAARPYMLHPGGLNNWKQVFGDQSSFFKDQPWYVASYNGGADSAQIFTAGGYRFLHIGLEMAPSDAVLRWASSVIERYPALPTIVSTHDHLSGNGERRPSPVMDLKAVDPVHNNPDDVWEKFLSRHDQIFLVLSGHQRGQALRIDKNAAGHKVYQVLSDYQARGQTAIDAGIKGDVGVGDGWLRLMTFQLRGQAPAISVRTYSTYYKAYSSELPDYARWYRALEKPLLSDADFLAQDEFTVQLDDFRERFGAATAQRSGTSGAEKANKVAQRGR